MSHFFTRTTRPTYQRGFTMIELLVVTTIIIVLSTIGLVSYRQATMRTRNSKRQGDMETVRQALVLYRTDNSTYPASINWNTMSPIESYLSVTSMTDPKNTNPYTYTYTQTNSGTGFTLCYYLEPDPGSQRCLANP